MNHATSLVKTGELQLQNSKNCRLSIDCQQIMKTLHQLHKNYKYQIPQMWVKYRFERFDQIRVLPRVKYGFVTVAGQIENRVKYGFVTVRNLLLVRAIRGVRGIRKLP
jgi:hypothetical protein